LESFIKKVEQSWIDHKTQVLTGNDSIRSEVEKIFDIVESKSEEVLGFLDISCKVLLSGPPGFGKSAIAYEIAGKLKSRTEVEASVYEVDMPQLLSEKMGKTPKNVSKLFEEINKKTKDYYVVLIMDEIEVFFLSREDKQEHPDMNRAVAELMTQLDRATKNKKLYIIGLTNYKDKLDPAVLRRFSFHYEVESPKESDYLAFFENQSFPIAGFNNDSESLKEVCEILLKKKLNFDSVKKELRKWYLRHEDGTKPISSFKKHLNGGLE